MNIPAKLAKGDSITFGDDPTVDNLRNTIDSSLWTLKYAIRGAVSLDLTATASGTGWSTAISAVQSATLKAGKYFWQAYVVDIATGLKRITLGKGEIEITPDLVSSTAIFDGRSQIQTDLESVQAAMRAMVAGGAVQAYTVAGRQIQKMPMSELIVLESKLKAELVRENKAASIANGLGNPHNMYVRFK
jgi:hypothetical protein